MCDLLCFAIAKTVKKHTALETANYLMYEIILRYGFSKVIRTDRGDVFSNDLLRDMNKLMNLGHLMYSGWRPTFAEKVERLYKTIVQLISKTCSEDQKDWSERDVYEAECKYIESTKSCFGNAMSFRSGSNVWVFQGQLKMSIRG